jgi:chromosome segregation ATPase
VYTTLVAGTSQKRAQLNIEGARASLNEFKEDYKRMNSRLPAMHSKVQQLKADYSKFTMVEQHEQRVAQLAIAVPWAEAERAEQAAAAAAAHAAAMDSKVRAVESGLVQCEADAAAHANDQAEREAECAERQQAVQTAAAAAAALQQELAVAQAPQAALTAALRSHELQLKEHTAELHRLQK